MIWISLRKILSEKINLRNYVQCKTQFIKKKNEKVQKKQGNEGHGARDGAYIIGWGGGRGRPRGWQQVIVQVLVFMLEGGFKSAY